MRSLPLCAAWLIFLSVGLGLLSIRTNPLEVLFLFLLTIYETQAPRRRGSRRPREQKMDQLPKAADPQAFPGAVARAHQMS